MTMPKRDMSGPLRNTRGCYTCRLRRKKCDETHPYCSTCSSLSITCYGYGTKPDWMDKGEKERAMANLIKEKVKYTSRRKDTTKHTAHNFSAIGIEPRFLDSSTDVSSNSPESSNQDKFEPPSDDSSPPNEQDSMLWEASVKPGPVSMTGHSVDKTISSISTDEFFLLMHFIDKVFSLQYPLYQPAVVEGGRGWLLAVLLRTKSLYYSALALSAYHRRICMLDTMSQPSGVAALIQQEEYLEVCIKSVYKSTEGSCSSKKLGMWHSVVQLVFYELFTGQDNAWQVHLGAATDLFQKGCTTDLRKLNMNEKGIELIEKDLPLSNHEPEVTEDVVNFRFLTSTVIWLDITSSITTGTEPELQRFHATMISHTSQNKLEVVMGSKNWVMIEIGRIATLQEPKFRLMAQLNSVSHCAEMERTVNDISSKLLYGLPHETLEDLNMSEYNADPIFGINSDTTTIVTHAFALMALVYLHFLIYDLEKLEILDSVIARAMKVIRHPDTVKLHPALILPLFIFGVVAGQYDEEYFRSIFSVSPLVDPCLKHRGRILPILEEIWHKRRTISGFMWKDCLHVADGILLI